MIVFDLQCLASGDRFEAWFRSNADFDQQLKRGLVQCPFCESSRVTKAPMAPLISASRSGPDEAMEVITQLAALQAELLAGSRWVGDRFAYVARAMHLGEIASGPVHGEANAEQVRSLVEDDVPIAPLPLPVVPPDQVN